MLAGFAAHRRSPKPAFYANCVPLIRNSVAVSRDAAPLTANDRCMPRMRIKHDIGDDAGVTSRGLSEAEFGLEQIVDDLRVGLAAG